MMSKVRFKFREGGGPEIWGEFPLCPECGQDTVSIMEDWGYDEGDGFSGYDVDCDSCGASLGHISYPGDIPALIEQWKTNK